MDNDMLMLYMEGVHDGRKVMFDLMEKPYETCPVVIEDNGKFYEMTIHADKERGCLVIRKGNEYEG